MKAAKGGRSDEVAELLGEGAMLEMNDEVRFRSSPHAADALFGFSVSPHAADAMFGILRLSVLMRTILCLSYLSSCGQFIVWHSLASAALASHASGHGSDVFSCMY